MLSRFLSYQVSRLRSLVKFQDFAVLLASPINCHGVSLVSTCFCLVVVLQTIRQMWIAWQSWTYDVLQSAWRWWRRPRGEGDTHIKRTGVLVEILKRTLKRYQDPVLWAWLEIFSLLRDTNSYITHYPLWYFFSDQYPKRHSKSSRCRPFEAKHSNGYLNFIFNS